MLLNEVSDWTDQITEDFLKSIDFNQGMSTAMSKSSIDDEIMYILSQKQSESYKFNMFELTFNQCQWKRLRNQWTGSYSEPYCA